METKTLADTFLADFGSDEELSDNDEELQDNDSMDTGNSDLKELNEQVAKMKADSVFKVLRLLKSNKLVDHLKKIERYAPDNASSSTPDLSTFNEEEYKLIVDSNALVIEIANEINAIHKFIRDHYSPKFGELEKIVSNPLDYARVVKRIGNETDISKKDLQDILPPAIIMVVSISLSSVVGNKILSEDQMKIVNEACDACLELDEQRKKILAYVESRMNLVAPNLTAIVGSTITAKLVGAAGGLQALAKLPSCNFQVLGSNKKDLAGFSTASVIKHIGYIAECDIIKTTPFALREKACRLIGAKCTLASRIDNFKQCPNGAQGKKFREDIEKRIAKWQEPPPAKLVKALAAPDDKPRKKRGGKRLRKMKERYKVTELQKQKNRMAFGKPQEEVGNTGKGLGMLGMANKVKITLSDRKINKKLAAKQKEYSGGTTTSARSNVHSGLATSLAFTPVQGFDLMNPEAAKKRVEEANKKYFSEVGTFTHVSSVKDKNGITL